MGMETQNGNVLVIASPLTNGILILVMDITEACKSLNISGIKLEMENMQVIPTKQDDEIKLELRGLLKIDGDGNNGHTVVEHMPDTDTTHIKRTDMVVPITEERVKDMHPITQWWNNASVCPSCGVMGTVIGGNDSIGTILFGCAKSHRWTKHRADIPT